MAIPLWLLLLITLPILLGGLWLLSRNLLFPPRQGTAPHCRRCQYNLSGTPADAPGARCPECGAPLSAHRAVVRGLRRRHLGLAATGVVLILVSAFPIGLEVPKQLRRVRWIQHYPLEWVIQDYQSNTLLTILRANHELMRRLDNGSLSARQEQRLIELFLAEHARPDFRLNPGGQAIRKLGELYAAGKLNADQAERFRQQCFRITIEANLRFPVVGPWPLEVDFKHRMPPQFITDELWLIEYERLPRKQQINGFVGLNGHFESGIARLPLAGPFTPGPQRGKLTIIITLNTENGRGPDGRPTRFDLKSAAEGDPNARFIIERVFEFSGEAVSSKEVPFENAGLERLLGSPRR